MKNNNCDSDESIRAKVTEHFKSTLIDQLPPEHAAINKIKAEPYGVFSRVAVQHLHNFDRHLYVKLVNEINYFWRKEYACCLEYSETEKAVAGAQKNLLLFMLDSRR